MTALLVQGPPISYGITCFLSYAEYRPNINTSSIIKHVTMYPQYDNNMRVKSKF
jgi:hypothetical protein